MVEPCLSVASKKKRPLFSGLKVGRKRTAGDDGAVTAKQVTRWCAVTLVTPAGTAPRPAHKEKRTPSAG